MIGINWIFIKLLSVVVKDGKILISYLIFDKDDYFEKNDIGYFCKFLKI